jgi:hypothetical protein
MLCLFGQILFVPGFIAGNFRSHSAPAGILDHLAPCEKVFAVDARGDSDLFEYAGRMQHGDKPAGDQVIQHSFFTAELPVVRGLLRRNDRVMIRDAGIIHKAGAGPDPFLLLENSKGITVAQDDDGGGNLNAKISYSPPQDGEYRIIAATISLHSTSTVYRQVVFSKHFGSLASHTIEVRPIGGTRIYLDAFLVMR